MSGGHRPCAVILSAITLLFANTPSLPAQVAYVADAQLDVVTALDSATATITATIPVGPGLRPCGIALSPDGETAYVANPTSDTVSVIAVPAMTTSTIHLSCPPDGCSPKGVIVSPDGRLLYVISETFGGFLITEVDARAQVVGRTFELASPGVSSGCGVGTLTPDGRFLYVRVPGHPGNPFELAVVDTTIGTEVARLEDGPFYDAVALANGTEVLAPGAGRIAVISTATHAVARVIPIDGDLGRIVTSSDGSTAYVVSAGGLLVVDVAGGSVDATIPLGERFSVVSDMVISPNGELVLLAELGSQSIIEIDTATRSIAGTIVLDHRPQDIAVSPDATTLYVTNADSDLRGGTLSQVDLRSGVASRLFRPASPAAVAATAGGTLLFVVNAWSEEVVVIDARLNRSVARIPVASPTSVAIDSHDELVFVGTIAGNVAVIDRAAMAVRDSIPVGGPVRALAVAPDGNRLYVATSVDFFTSSVAVIDTPTMASVATIPVAEPIADLLMAPDGETLYAAAFKFYLNDITGGVVVLDLEAKEIVTTIVTGGVSDLAISPDGQTVYASTVFYDLFGHRPDQVSIIDAGTRSIRDSVEIDEIAAIAIDPTRDALYAASRGRPGEIAIIDTSSLEISAAVQSGLLPSDIAVIGEPEDRLCAGDCDADGAVTVAELIRGVNILLSGARIDSCPAIDADSDQHVTVADLVSAVQRAIYGCSGGGE